MKPLWRISLSLFCGFCGFAVGFVVGFYLSFLFGANIHDVMPGVFGLAVGVVGGVGAFKAIRKRLAKSLG